MNNRFSLRFDWILLSIMILLLCFGLVMIYSTTLNAQTPAEGKGAFQLQILYTIIGIFVYFFIASLNYRNYIKWAKIFFVVTCSSLIIVLFWGVRIQGATRWINLGFTNYQPSEAAKLLILIVACTVLSQRSRFANDIHFFGISGLILIIPTGLVLLQPDVGTAFIFFVLWIGLVIGSGVHIKYLLLTFATMVALFPFAWPLLKPYQKERILIFLDPTRDPRGTGYNVIQAIIAIGAGGIWGLGLGQGTQSQYKFLPVRHTDFIFSVVSEELGLIGSTILFMLFGYLFWRILSIAKRADDNFGKLLAIGVFVLLCSQMFINIGMNIGIMPVTGVPLPLISSGGSSLLTSMALLGLVQSISLHTNYESQKADVVTRIIRSS